MKTIKRKSVGTHFSMCVQPAFIIGTHHAKDGKKNEISYSVSRGEVVDVPVLDASRWVYECEVVNSIETGESTTFFCKIKNIQIDEQLECVDTFDVNLSVCIIL